MPSDNTVAATAYNSNPTVTAETSNSENTVTAEGYNLYDSTFLAYLHNLNWKKYRFIAATPQ